MSDLQFQSVALRAFGFLVTDFGGVANLDEPDAVRWELPGIGVDLWRGRRSGEVRLRLFSATPDGEVSAYLETLEELSGVDPPHPPTPRTDGALLVALEFVAARLLRVGSGVLRDPRPLAEYDAYALREANRVRGAEPLWRKAAKALHAGDFARAVELYEMVALHYPNVPLPPLEQKRWDYSRRRAS